MHDEAVPTATHDEPTHHFVWEMIDRETVRIRFEELEPSDGIPCEIEAERSATVAVVLTDLTEPLELVAQMARRDGMNVNVVEMPVLLGPGRVGVIGLTVGNWKRFQAWIIGGIREAESWIFRSLENRKATAVMFRLRLLAAEVQHLRPPNGLDFFALRLEQ